MRLLRPLSALIYCCTLGMLLQRAFANRATFAPTDVHVAAPASERISTEVSHAIHISPSLARTAMLFKEIQAICPAVRSVETQWYPNKTIHTTVTLHSPRAAINQTLVLYEHGLAPRSLFTSQALSNVPTVHVASSCLEHPACAKRLIHLLATTDTALWDIFDITLTATSQVVLTDKNDSRLSLHCQLHTMPSASLCATAQTLFHDLEDIFSFENPDESLIIDARFSGRLIVSQAGGNHGTYETRTTNHCY